MAGWGDAQMIQDEEVEDNRFEIEWQMRQKVKDGEEGGKESEAMSGKDYSFINISL